MAAALLGLAPVLSFLAVLVLLDSYKLVRLRLVLGILAAGALVAVAAAFANSALLEALPLGYTAYTRYVAPPLEELLKGLVLVLLVRAHRVGFLVDAAILGFATGAGFALVENLQYLRGYPEAALGTWVVRGFGTALMHGGATAIFAMLGLALAERARRPGAAAFLPGYALAVALHSLFNHFVVSPWLSTLVTAALLPLAMQVVFARSERTLARWLGTGFDADARMLELIKGGRISDAPVGIYLHTLKERFRGPVVADLLCYVRLYTELALRAKGVLMLRENGFEAPVDDATRAKFEEMRYLEKSIGRTGLLAIQPMLHMSHKDLWQLHMLGK